MRGRRRSSSSNSRSNYRNRRGNRSRSRHGRARSRSRSARRSPSRGRRRSPVSGFSNTGPGPQAQISAPNLSIPTRDVKVVNIPQNAVGTLIGPQGETLKMFERQTGCCIMLDQSTKSQGFTVAQISGPSADNTEAAAAFINERVQHWASQKPDSTVPEGAASEEFEIEQKMVGMIMGRGAETIRAMKQQSGALINLDQSRRAEGISVVKIVGTSEAVQLAKELVMEKITEVNIKEGWLEMYSVVIDQRDVGNFVGPAGQFVNQMKEQTGAKILLDQTTQTAGYSTVRIGVGPGAEAGYQMVKQKVEQLKALRESLTPNATSATSPPIPEQAPPMIVGQHEDAYQVDQRWIGWVIGKGGDTLKHIKASTGANVFVDQDTRDRGFSIVRIKNPNTPQAHMALQMIAIKIQECMKMPTNWAQIHRNPPPIWIKLPPGPSAGPGLASTINSTPAAASVSTPVSTPVSAPEPKKRGFEESKDSAKVPENTKEGKRGFEASNKDQRKQESNENLEKQDDAYDPFADATAALERDLQEMENSFKLNSATEALEKDLQEAGVCS